MTNFVKHKLIKDLPGIKAGNVVSTYKEDSFILIITEAITDISIHESEFDEWFENKKPLSIHSVSKWDEIHSILSDGTIISQYYDDDDDDIVDTIKVGNAFVSEDAAITEVRKRKAIQKIMHHIVCSKMEHTWNLNNEWETLYRICMNGEYIVGKVNYQCSEVLPYFTSEEDALEIIQKYELSLDLIFNK